MAADSRPFRDAWTIAAVEADLDRDARPKSAQELRETAFAACRDVGRRLWARRAVSRSAA
jgi:hypothetical protein